MPAGSKRGTVPTVGVMLTRSNPEVRFCTTSDGVQLAYSLTGNGPPIVLSAGWMTHLEYQWRNPIWLPWLQALSSRHTLLCFDSRGCGLSDRDIGQISFQTTVDDFECVLTAAGFDRVPIVAVCQGGPVALEYAARRPERVSRLVLYGTYAMGRLQRAQMDAPTDLAVFLRNLIHIGWGQKDHSFLKMWFSQFQPGAGVDQIGYWAELQRESTSAQNAFTLLMTGWGVDVRDAARRISCPALVAHIDRDAVTPYEEGRALAGLLRTCQFLPLNGVNHMLLPEDPAWVRLKEGMERFLSEEPAKAEADMAKPARTDEQSAGTASGIQALAGLNSLTIRERDVLEAIASGHDNAEIADVLGLAPKTVRNYVTLVLEKIGVRHRYEAIVLARQAGLGNPPGADSH